MKMPSTAFDAVPGSAAPARRGADARKSASGAVALASAVGLMVGLAVGMAAGRTDHAMRAPVTRPSAAQPDGAAQPRHSPGAAGSPDSHAMRAGPARLVAPPLARGELTGALACAADDARERALACLQRLAEIGLQQPDVREAFLRRLAREPDPRAKAEILALATPVPLASEDLAPLLREIEGVRASRDPALRGDALLAMAQWDRSDAVAGPLRNGLYDPEPDVVRAAITGTLASNVRAPELKDALLVLASDAAPNSELRWAAVDALRDFALDREEYALYARAREAMPEELRR